MQLAQLRHFTVLAEELNFRRAARRLFIAPQSLSASIQRLEREVGGPLFERDTRRVALTERGLALLPRALGLLADADSLLDDLASRPVPVSDELTVGLFATAAAELTKPILHAFHLAHPEVRVILRPTAWNPATSLLAGDADIAFVVPPIEEQAVAVVPLFDEPRVAAIPLQHDLAEADEVTTADLHDQRWGRRFPFETAVWDGRWSLVAERNGDLGQRVDIEPAEDAASQLMALANANAVLTLPASAARFLSIVGTHYAPVHDVPLARTQVALAFVDPRPSRPTAPLIAEFVAIALAITARLVTLLPGAVASTANPDRRQRSGETV